MKKLKSFRIGLTNSQSGDIMQIYNLADRVTNAQAESLGFAYGQKVRDVHAILTGERRPPRKGEWYLSGAIPEAYRAPNDLSTPYQICRLVKTRTETRTVLSQ